MVKVRKRFTSYVQLPLRALITVTLSFRMVHRHVTTLEGVRKDFKGPSFHNVPADHARVLIDQINDQLHSRRPTSTEPY